MSFSFLVVFHLVVAAMLALDLFVFNRKSHVISIKESLLWSALWILLALLFDVYIYFEKGPEAAFAFLTGYLLEKSLSIDNLFVFLLIFSAFAVDGMIEQFHYLKYGLAIILMFVGVKLLLMDIVEIKTIYSLLFILLTITTSIVFSLKAAKCKQPAIHEENV